MKRYLSILAGLALAALAGCGGGNNPACGALDQMCCANNTCTAAGTTCQAGTCKMGGCGVAGKACCPGNTCTDGSTCTNGTCVKMAMCGATGQPCCTTGTPCNTGLVCNAGTCGMMMGGNTGDPCTKATDCAGTKAVCITKDTQGVTWPGGYCTSQCNPTKNDPQTGLNTACPGGQGLCLGQGTTGACELACTESTGGMPCPRMGYSCFQGCEPTSLSECDPTKKGACVQDGGVFLGDGGEYSGRVCVRIGADNVGECTNGCDVFTQNCTGANEGCFASFDTGEGTCDPIFNGGADGAPCMYLNACDPGFGCHSEGNGAVCRHYCGGPNMVACPMAQKCGNLSMTVMSAVVGLCGP